MTDETAEPWLCACGEMTLVTHWAWPSGVGVHDPDLAYLEAAGLAEQGKPDQPCDLAGPAPDATQAPTENGPSPTSTNDAQEGS